MHCTVIANFFVFTLMQKARPLLIGNMTQTKTPIASDGLTKAVLGLDRQTVKGSGYY